MQNLKFQYLEEKKIHLNKHGANNPPKVLQNKYGLPATGEITYTDWNLLKTTYDKLLKTIPSEYSEYANYLYPGYFLSKGMSGEAVFRVQKFLLAICRFDHSIPGVRVNGVFDDLTEQSVRKIQNDYNIIETGLVGPLSWEKIVELSKR